MDVWMYGCMDVWMYGCMDVWMYVHTHRDSLQWIYIYIYIHAHVQLHCRHIPAFTEQNALYISSYYINTVYIIYTQMLVYMCTLFVHKHILYLYINFESQKVYTLTNTEYERRIYPLDLQAWYCIYAHYLPMLFRYFYRHMHCVYLYSIMHDVCLAHFYFTLKPFVPCKVYWYSIQYIYIDIFIPFWCRFRFHLSAQSPCHLVVGRSGFAGSSRLSNMGTGLWSGAQFVFLG